MQEITIQKWIEFYRGNKSMTKFISLLKKEDLMLLSFTPDNLIIEENLPELGILEEDIKSILYEDVRLNNKLMFVTEENSISTDMSQIKAKAQRRLIDEDDNTKGIFQVIIDKIQTLKEDKLTEEEKNQKIELEKITSSKKLLDVEKQIIEELEQEKQKLKDNIEITKSNFYRNLIEAKTRLVIAIYHGADCSAWQERYKDEFEKVLWSSVVQGEYELYGYEYPKIIKKLIERKIVSSKDLIDFSLPRGVEEGVRYPIKDISVDIERKNTETDEEYKKRKKEREKELYAKEVSRVQSEINRKVKINKIKILFGV